MITYVYKRDGRKQKYRIDKVSGAIKKAFDAENLQFTDDIFEKIYEFIEPNLENKKTINIEDLQDIVESALMKSGYTEVAKQYILYRAKRNKERQHSFGLVKILRQLFSVSAKAMDLKRENANINGDSAMGSMLRVGAESSKYIVLNEILPEKISTAHTDGDIHIHDLDFYKWTFTCCQIDAGKLLQRGFNTGHSTLRSPHSIHTAFELACIIIQSNQNDQHGGQSIPCLDYYLAPFVRLSFVSYIIDYLRFCGVLSVSQLENLKNQLRDYLKSHFNDKTIFDKVHQIDIANILMSAVDFSVFLPSKSKSDVSDAVQSMTSAILHDLGVKDARDFIDYILAYSKQKTDEETYQGAEALLHNLNTMHSRAGAQVPFSSINYGTDTSEEGRMIIYNLLKVTDKGVGNNETPIFPIQIFKVKSGVNFNEGDPNYDLFKYSLVVSAKRLFPNYSFIDAPFNLQYYKEGRPETEVAYMGCRTRVIGNVYDPSREIVTGRGNLSFTSINLPRLAIESKGDIQKFYAALDKKLDLCVEQLMLRFEEQSKLLVRNFPFLMGQGVWIDSDNLTLDDSVAEVMKHGTLSVGFIGLAETLVALTGKHHGESEESQKLGLEIIGHMRKRMDLEAQNRKLNFSLLATPAEGLSGRFVRMDKKRFGEIPGVTDRDYYTNSFHVPVYYPTSIENKLKLEGPYHALTNAGHISYIELDGDPKDNPEVMEKVVRLMYENGIGYGSINHPVDRDPVCGFSGVINGDVCPFCHRKETAEQPFERIRRITGYLVGTLDKFNDAKKAEVNDRLPHNVNYNELDSLVD